jgi:hypothetical protein
MFFHLLLFFRLVSKLAEKKRRTQRHEKKDLAHCKMNVVLIESSFFTVKENVVLIELKPKKGGLHERVVTCIVVLKDH